jgi:tetratricopeptide (TPR) repeat protein
MLPGKYKILIIALILILTHTNVTYGYRIDNWGHYKKGIELMKKGEYDRALNEISYYLHQPKMHRHMFGVSYFGRGLVFQTLGNDTQAIQEFEQAIKNDLHPEIKIADKAYMNIGTIYMKKKLYKDAAYAYVKAVESNPENGLSHYYLGLAYFRMGDYERAGKASVEAKRLGITLSALSDGLAKRGIKIDEPEPEASINRTNQPEPEVSINKTNESEPEASLNKTNEPEPEASLNKTNEPEPEVSLNKTNESEPEASLE